MKNRRASRHVSGRSTASALFRVAGLVFAISLAAGCGWVATEVSPTRTATTTPTLTHEVDLGRRPFELLESMSPGPLRDQLEGCSQGSFRAARFSIGHRGAPLGYPEHTREGYRAAARMGAGQLECDVTHTADDVAVCRHSQCDLATTTNLLETPLAATCREPFRPAAFDAATGALAKPAGALCCTSDLTLEEFRQLKGRRDTHEPRALTIEAFLAPPLGPDVEARGDDIARQGELMTHAESIALFRELGVAMIPELKADAFERRDPPGATSPDYARGVLDAYRDAGVPPEDVRIQSFEVENIRLWLRLAPAYGARAIWAVEPWPDTPAPSQGELTALYAEGIRALGLPIPMLLRLDEAGALRATEYARRARQAGLEIFAWTIERSGPIRNGMIDGRRDDFYLGTLLPALRNEGDIYQVIHALAQEAFVRGIFSDWPATTTYYANCFGLD